MKIHTKITLIQTKELNEWAAEGDLPTEERAKWPMISGMM
jgi:hypothetical protein